MSSQAFRMRRSLRNQNEIVSYGNSLLSQNNGLRGTPSLQDLKNVHTQSDKSNSADNNKLIVKNIHEDHQFINTNMRSKKGSSENKENRNIKSKHILVESSMDNMQNKTVRSRKNGQKLVNAFSDAICNTLENSENEFPSSGKNTRSKTVKNKIQKNKINNIQKCESENSRSGETIKQVLNKQNFTYSDIKVNSVIGKETRTIKSNIQEALKSLENIPMRKSTRLQEKPSSEKVKIKSSKTSGFDGNEIRYKKCENSGAHSTSCEDTHNEKKCERLPSKMPKRENYRKFLCNVMSPITENFNENCDEFTHTPRELRTEMQLFTNETVKPNISEDRLAIYNFEYDENEEPCNKKRRKKKIYNKKPKLCSQNLTVNRIKFGSVSGLNSTKSKFGSTSSINSVQSDCEKKASEKSEKHGAWYIEKHFNGICTPRKKIVQTFDNIPRQNTSLSIVIDSNKICGNFSPKVQSQSFLHVKSSQSQSLPTPLSNAYSLIDCKKGYSAQNNSLNASFAHSPARFECHILNCVDSYSENNLSLNSSVQQFHSSNVHNTSYVSIDGMNFSTPCKKRCDRTYSSGILNEHSFNFVAQDNERHGEKDFASEKYDDSNCFGFGTDENIEEPLLSSIKKNVASSKKDALPGISCRREIFPSDSVNVQDIIQVLQAEVNRIQKNKSETRMTENSENNETDTSFSVLEDDDKPVYFKKPPRRSYERVRHYWEQEDTDEERTDEEEVDEVLEVETKKHHRKKTKTHAEVEAEKLAAKLNSQFQEVDKFNLCVE